MPTGTTLIETISLELGAQDPWPNDVKLYQPYAVEQILLPDNANCLAVQAYLHMCGLPFQIEHRANAEFMSPSGKVPFIKCGAFVISELEPIVQFVSNKGISLTSELDGEQKSDMRAYMSIIHTVLMNAELYICWCDEKTYNEVTLVRNGSVYPWPLNYFHTRAKRSSIIKWLKIHGWYQKSLDAVYEEVEICCKALSERLEGKEYFFGNKITELDSLLYGHVFANLSNPSQMNSLTNILIKYPNLVRHCYKICVEFMPHNSVIYTEKPFKRPFDYKKYKENQLAMTRKKNRERTQFKKKEKHVKYQCDSVSGKLSEESSVLDITDGANDCDIPETSDTGICMEDGSGSIKTVKRISSAINCCAFP